MSIVSKTSDKKEASREQTTEGIWNRNRGENRDSRSAFVPGRYESGGG